MPRIDYKGIYEKAETLSTRVWYRGPLWADDHLLGEADPYLQDTIAWCGRALGAALQMGDDPDNEYGGLWISERKGGKCALCASRQKEWESA